MATIKGQNLRVVYEEECVAMAQSCTLHVSMETADVSSKDDDDAWARVMPTGLSWDLSVDALVTDGNFYYNEAMGTPTPMSQQTQTLKYRSFTPIYLREGDFIYLTPSANNLIVGVITDSDQVLKESASAGQRVEYEAGGDMVVYVAKSTNTGSVEVKVTDPANTLNSFLSMVYGGRVSTEILELHFTIGQRNRETDNMFVSGPAVLEDISVNATNRQPSTYTARFRGNGPLELGEL